MLVTKTIDIDVHVGEQYIINVRRSSSYPKERKPRISKSPYLDQDGNLTGFRSGRHGMPVTQLNTRDYIAILSLNPGESIGISAGYAVALGGILGVYSRIKTNFINLRTTQRFGKLNPAYEGLALPEDMDSFDFSEENGVVRITRK